MKGRYGSPLSGSGKTTAWRKVCGKVGVFEDNFLRCIGLTAGSFICRIV